MATTKDEEILIVERRNDEEERHFERSHHLEKMGSPSLAYEFMPLLMSHAPCFVQGFRAHPLLVIIFQASSRTLSSSSLRMSSAGLLQWITRCSCVSDMSCSNFCAAV